jgi:hypothetical protein
MVTNKEIEILEMRLGKIEDMLRHIHSNVENVLRKVEVNEYKIIALASLVQSASNENISNMELDSAINIDPDCYSNLDEIYSPIDDVDKVAWEEHIRKEKEREEESERLDWNT